MMLMGKQLRIWTGSGESPSFNRETEATSFLNCRLCWWMRRDEICLFSMRSWCALTSATSVLGVSVAGRQPPRPPGK